MRDSQLLYVAGVEGEEWEVWGGARTEADFDTITETFGVTWEYVESQEDEEEA